MLFPNVKPVDHTIYVCTTFIFLSLFIFLYKKDCLNALMGMNTEHEMNNIIADINLFFHLKGMTGIRRSFGDSLGDTYCKNKSISLKQSNKESIYSNCLPL